MAFGKPRIDKINLLPIRKYFRKLSLKQNIQSGSVAGKKAWGSFVSRFGPRRGYRSLRSSRLGAILVRQCHRTETGFLAASEWTGQMIRNGWETSFARSRGYRSIRSAHVVCRWKRRIDGVEIRLVMASEFTGQVIRNTITWILNALSHVLGRLTGGRIPEKRVLSAVVCGLTAGAVAFFMFNVFPNAYAVELDGTQVAVVADYEDVEAGVKAYVQEVSSEYQQVYYTDDITYIPVRANSDEFSSPEQIRMISQRLNFMAQGWRMFIDGDQVAVLQARDDGEAVIQELIDSFVPVTDSGELVIEKVRIAQEIEYRQAEVEIGEFSDLAAFRNSLLVGEEVQETYTVQANDTISQIAAKFGLNSAELREINPKHREEGAFLQIGEELNLNVVERPVQVVAEGYLVRQENIPFETKYKNDSTLWRGQHKTVESGQAGSKEVKYSVQFENGSEVERAVVAETVLEAPVDRVVASGTRAPISAARGTTVTATNTGGSLNWPISGRISSPYGSRGRGFHSGIDIGARTGTPVYAAESGVVSFAGWNGGYGYLLIIDHGGGMQTYYAHLSRFNVSKGTSVGRGQLIASSGNTGRSTGPHLHFEVRVGGSTRNPVNYLR